MGPTRAALSSWPLVVQEPRTSTQTDVAAGSGTQTWALAAAQARTSPCGTGLVLEQVAVGFHMGILVLLSINAIV